MKKTKFLVSGDGPADIYHIVNYNVRYFIWLFFDHIYMYIEWHPFCITSNHKDLKDLIDSIDERDIWHIYDYRNQYHNEGQSENTGINMYREGLSLAFWWEIYICQWIRR